MPVEQNPSAEAAQDSVKVIHYCADGTYFPDDEKAKNYEAGIFHNLSIAFHNYNALPDKDEKEIYSKIIIQNLTELIKRKCGSLRKYHKKDKYRSAYIENLFDSHYSDITLLAYQLTKSGHHRAALTAVEYGLSIYESDLYLVQTAAKLYSILMSEMTDMAERLKKDLEHREDEIRGIRIIMDN